MFVNFRDKTTVVVHSADAFAPVALLLLKSLQLCEKPGLTSKRFATQREMLKAQNITIKTPLSYCSDEISANDINERIENDIVISREHFMRGHSLERVSRQAKPAHNGEQIHHVSIRAMRTT